MPCGRRSIHSPLKTQPFAARFSFSSGPVRMWQGGYGAPWHDGHGDDKTHIVCTSRARPGIAYSRPGVAGGRFLSGLGSMAARPLKSGMPPSVLVASRHTQVPRDKDGYGAGNRPSGS
ncbi:hypothetical protein NL676_014513 [Syzygium grande]|nr:hypothetical protein NL676_014513 [Syzygium grande]